MKKLIVLFLTAILIINFFYTRTCFADDINEGIPSIEAFNNNITGKLPYINATAAIVIDMKSGRILYEKNSNVKKSIASTTKIMTAIIAIENGNMNDEIIISKRAASVSGSSINLQQGSKMKLNELLYGLLLNSGNDAAIAIAEHIGGSVEGFIDLMNEKAKALGALNTSYKSPHGLDKPDQYSTAYDLALITRYALKNEKFSKIVATKSINIANLSLYNTNEMLGLYPGADGVKTGYTGQAGRCLVTSATRGKWRIISVVLNSPTRNIRAQSSKDILDYAFENYIPYKIIGSDKKIKVLPVKKGILAEVPVYTVDEVEMPLTKEEIEGLEASVELPDILNAPVVKGVEIGLVKYYIKGKLIGETALKTANNIPKKTIYNYLKDIFIEWSAIMR